MTKPRAPKTGEAPPPEKGGRPSKYTDAILVTIVERLSKGEPMAVICRDEGMPAARTVRDWVANSEQVSAAIAHAREEGEDYLAAECLAIADDARNDFMEARASEGDEKAGQFNGEHVQRSKLRIETRLKLLAKWNPKKYGDRVAVDHGVQDNLAEQLRAARERVSGG